MSKTMAFVDSPDPSQLLPNPQGMRLWGYRDGDSCIRLGGEPLRIAYPTEVKARAKLEFVVEERGIRWVARQRCSPDPLVVFQSRVVAIKEDRSPTGSYRIWVDPDLTPEQADRVVGTVVTGWDELYSPGSEDEPATRTYDHAKPEAELLEFSSETHDEPPYVGWVPWGLVHVRQKRVRDNFWPAPAQWLDIAGILVFLLASYLLHHHVAAMVLTLLAGLGLFVIRLMQLVKTFGPARADVWFVPLEAGRPPLYPENPAAIVHGQPLRYRDRDLVFVEQEARPHASAWESRAIWVAPNVSDLEIRAVLLGASEKE